MNILGSIIAWALTLFGALKVALGFFFAANTVTLEDNAAAAERYLAAANTGEAINEGIMMFIIGVVIGLLVKIAKKSAGS